MTGCTCDVYQVTCCRGSFLRTDRSIFTFTHTPSTLSHTHTHPHTLTGVRIFLSCSRVSQRSLSFVRRIWTEQDTTLNYFILMMRCVCVCVCACGGGDNPSAPAVASFPYSPTGSEYETVCSMGSYRVLLGTCTLDTKQLVLLGTL